MNEGKAKEAYQQHLKTDHFQSVAHLPGLRSTILLIALHSPTAHQCADARKG